MPFAREAFSTLGDVQIVEGRAIGPEHVRDADLLAVRSTTRVDARLLEGSRVRFVGTATIGIDHMDIAYLERRGIHWCYAPGCNANSVSEYVTAALLCLANCRGFTLEGKTIGVVGVGNVGRLMVLKAQALGMRVLQNDPPRQRAERTPDFVSLDQILEEADVVTLHVPLTRMGPDATYHMAEERFFARLKCGAIFINCARGATTDTAALINALNQGVAADAVIDTWEGEPEYSLELLARTAIATPHIAGHSFEGRVMGTVMVYREACRFLGVEPQWTPDDCWPPPPVPRVQVNSRGRPDEAVLWEIVRQVYDIEADDRSFRESSRADLPTRRVRFDELRRNYPMRREFRFTRVVLEPGVDQLRRKVADLGFQVE